MAQTPSQQIQVIPQPLSSSQLQQLYMPQQHILLPGNVTLQQGGTLTSSPGVSLQLQAKPSGDSKTFGVQNIQPYQNALILQPKPTFSAVQNQVLSSHMKQLSPRTSVASTASGTLYSHPQLLGSYALSPLPPGYTWASPPGSFPCSQSPIIISREQPNIYVQSQSQAIQLPVVSGQFMAPTSLSCSHISQGVQSIATQTIAPSSLNSGTISYPPQEQNVVNSAISEKLTQPSVAISPLANDQPSAKDSKTVASMQTETAPAENLRAVHEVESIKEEPQFSSLPIVQAAETVPPAVPVLIGNPCATEMPVDVCPSPTSAVSSTSSALDVQQSVLSSEELSSDFVPRCSDGNECHEKMELQSVPEKPKKPVADIKPVPEKADSSADVPENIDNNKHSVKLTNEQKMARFNPVIKLKRLKPQDSILTPYSRVMKDKQPQKAIVKPQMLSHVIDSYVIQEVTLKSVVDSSSTDISESSNSGDKSEVSMPGVSSPCMESSNQMIKDTVPERKEHLPVIKVSRGRGRPRGSGRTPKKNKEIMVPIRRSLRQRSTVSIIDIDKDDFDVSEEEDNRSRFAECSSICQTDDEHFPPHDTTDSDLSFDISTLAAVSSEIGKTVVDVHKKPPDVWSVSILSLSIPS
ncbi:hypothetical protein AVEN_105549-1 [Araneus ventricosus]|uniref:Uncharacterized protein n=1 Tax=Araneus ventricosus TaxID=182803 RepID=A0A4Y2GPG5_ARAVE|nr:hypothetical protein AVEN_105549-1 [Araneus ventricosus]